MPGAWTQNYYHVVFSTLERRALIKPEIEERLHAYLGGLVRDLRCQLIAVNGMPDHIHLLVRYRADLAHSDLVRHVKTRSSRWFHETFAEQREFAWQNGYGGFTVSRSNVEAVESYIRLQKQHHERMDFQTEFLALLRKHGIEFDEGTVFQ